MPSDPTGSHQIIVLDAAGRAVYHEPALLSRGGVLDLAMPSLAAGSYELVLISSTQRQTGRFIIIAH